jgi:VanZ family protein
MMIAFLNWLRHFCKSFWSPFIWTLITIGLLCLPGSNVPSEGLFSIPHLDKPVHIILFGGIALSWSLFIDHLALQRYITLVLLICFATLLLGILLEFVQANFIPQRSFDIWDIVSDGIGAWLAFYWIQQAKK